MTPPNLDVLAGGLCAWVTIMLFLLHVITGPRHTQWFTLPDYVRIGFLATGGLFFWRAVNFFTLATSPLPPSVGRINAEGMIALVALAYTLTALTWYVATRTLQPMAWARLAWLVGIFRRDPDLAPVPMPVDAVADLMRSNGAEVATPPRAGVERLAGPLNDTPRDGAV